MSFCNIISKLPIVTLGHIILITIKILLNIGSESK